MTRAKRFGLVLATVALVLVPAATASAKKLTVVPGVSIAGIKIGSTQAIVEKQLGTPCDIGSSEDPVTHKVLSTLSFCAKGSTKVLTTVTLTDGKVDGISTTDRRIGVGSGISVGTRFEIARKALRRYYNKSVPIKYSNGYLDVPKTGSKHAFRVTARKGERVKRLEMSTLLDESL